MTGPTPADAPAAADAWHWVALSLALLAAYWPWACGGCWRAEVLPPDPVQTPHTPAALPRLLGQGLGESAQGLLLQAG